MRRKHHFIIGMGRSGTNLMLTILDTSKNVFCVPEVPLLMHFSESKSRKREFSRKDIEEVKDIISFVNYRKIFVIDFSELESKITSIDDYVNFAQESLLGFRMNQEKKSQVDCIIDKNPIYTFYVKEILRLIPSAKFIVMIRDPRAYIASSLEKPDLPDKKRTLFFHASVWREYALQIEMLRNKYPQQCLLVRYEDLVAETETIMKKICSHLGIPFSEEMKEHFVRTSVIDKQDFLISDSEKERLEKKYGQLEKPVNSERLESWKNTLDEKQLVQINFVLRKEAKSFGYTFPPLKPEIGLFLNPEFIIQKILVKGYFILARIFYHLPMKLREKIRKQV